MGRSFDPTIASNWDPTRAGATWGRLLDPFGTTYLGKKILDQYAKKPDLAGMPAAPGPGPDLTDEAIQQAALAEARRLGMLRGRQSTFLTGSTGAAPPATQTSTMLGG